MCILENIFVRIRIMKADMIQLNLMIQLQLFHLGISPSLCQHGICFHALLQIVIHKIKTWLGIGDFCNIRIDTVHTGQYSYCCDRKCRDCRYHGCDITATINVNYQKSQYAYNKHGFDQQSWHIVQHCIVSGHLCANLTGFVVVPHIKFFPVQHLDILQSIGCLDPPLGDP